MTHAHHGSDETEIRRLDAAWGDAASAHDAEKVAGFYSSRATLVWPGQPAVQGSANILQGWKDIIGQYRNLSLRFDPTRIDIAADRDLAIDFGVVELGYDDPKAGPTKEAAKYLVVWTREKDGWKVLYDSWNANADS